jgi:hypothetical protein
LCFCESRLSSRSADRDAAHRVIVSPPALERPDEPRLLPVFNHQRAGFRRKPQPPCSAPHQHRTTTCRRPLHRLDCLA